MMKISEVYSLRQYRMYRTALGVFFFVKFLLLFINWGTPALSVGERFAAASAFFLAMNLIIAIVVKCSLLLLAFACLYVFHIKLKLITSSQFDKTQWDYAVTEPLTLYFIILVLAFALLWELSQAWDKRTKAKKSGASMPAWLFYTAQLCFLASILFFAYHLSYDESFAAKPEILILLLIFFLFVFDPRWLRPSKAKSEQSPVLFFDGLCVLCNRWAQLLLEEDYTHIFRFSALQGQSALAALPKELVENKRALILWEQGKIYQGADAVLRVTWKLGGLWRLSACVLYLFPSAVRQFLYQALAKRRYKYFGSLESCRLPLDGEERYFLP